jgi:hypothetical protein
MTLEEFERLADELSPLDQVRLIEHLTHRLASALAEAQPAAASAADAWARWDQLREEFRTLGPASPSMSEQLAADRRGRDAVLTGGPGSTDVTLDANIFVRDNAS